MLKTIALIASGVSALSAVTTSLRALGKSLIFALPLLVRDAAGISAVGITLRIVPFLSLFFILLGIWLRVVSTRK
jgi:hypothetical protein